MNEAINSGALTLFSALLQLFSFRTAYYSVLINDFIIQWFFKHLDSRGLIHFEIYGNTTYLPYYMGGKER